MEIVDIIVNAKKMKKLERCGFCGSFFRGIDYLTTEEVEAIDAEKLDAVPLGYCPNAQEEHYKQNPEDYL